MCECECVSASVSVSVNVSVSVSVSVSASASASASASVSVSVSVSVSPLSSKSFAAPSTAVEKVGPGVVVTSTRSLAETTTGSRVQHLGERH